MFKTLGQGQKLVVVRAVYESRSLCVFNDSSAIVQVTQLYLEKGYCDTWAVLQMGLCSLLQPSLGYVSQSVINALSAAPFD